MSDSYTKLFGSITESTVWLEPAGTRLVWITMLAMARKDGCVNASVPGLARRANVTREETDAALACFLAPDPDSRSKENDGRRIEQIDGGWILLNHQKFAAIRTAEERREYWREWKKNKRAQECPPECPQSPQSSTESTESTPLALALALAPKRSKALVQQAARFEEFWAVYPRNEGKAGALRKWKARKLDFIADRIIDDVKARIAGHGQWQDPQYIPMGSKYLHESRWEDAITPRSNVTPFRRSATDDVNDLVAASGAGS